MENPGCQYEVLAHNPNGYIVLCLDCNHYQLGFGTTVLTFLAAELTRFRNKLAQEKTNAQQDGAPHQKTIRIPLGGANIRMALSANEAAQLLSLIDEAAAASVFGKLMEEMQWE